MKVHVATNRKNPPITKASCGTVSSKKKKKAGGSATTSNNKNTKKSAQQIILELVAESYSLGNDSLPRAKLTMGTGLATKTVANNLAKMKTKGLIECPDSKLVRLTPEGIEEAGPLIAAAPKTNAEYQERLKATLKGKQVQLFDLLADGKTHSRVDVAKCLGYDGITKGFVNLLGSLRGKKMLDYPDKESVQLADLCFHFGRP